ncbi:MAG: SRPBCC domain-containing protein [Acidimicrobiia bacterium]
MNAELSFDVPASPDAVFDHFTNPDLLVRWWPTGSETSPEPGGVYNMWWDGPGHHLRGRYLKIDRPSRLSSSWRFDHDDTTERTVDVAISASESGSRVTINHESGSEEESSGYIEGWEHFLGRLIRLFDSEN